ncbi:MAG: S26 family signal peptidase [Phycisphaerae bacterium]
MPPNRAKAQHRPTEAPSSQPAVQAESIKETTDSIVVAFILAFVFRAFIVEAFVIPTGSMAATLYGKHGALICADCGWENAYGLTDTSTRPPRYGPRSRVRCQNCNHLNTNLAVHDGVGVRAQHSRLSRSRAESGDRILVFKWPLDFGLQSIGLKRWDVTVFRNPTLPDQNFIKRLVGMPGDVLEIIDGDIYVVGVDELSEETVHALDELRHTKYKLRTHQPVDTDARLRFDGQALGFVLDELAKKLRIATKTPEAQQSLWQVVYNHDYPPGKLDAQQPYWQPQSPQRGQGWTDDGRRLTFSGGQASIRFAGKRIVDHNAYNIDMNPKDWNDVSDLRIEAVLSPNRGEGYVELVLPKNRDSFRLRLFADGRATLTRSMAAQPGSAEVIDEAAISPFEPGRPVEIAFQNVDYKVSAFVNGREVLATTPDQYAPDVNALRRNRRQLAYGPSINAADLELELLHVVLYRDAYYTSPTFDRSKISSWARRGWGTTYNPILLRQGEYFMLGDNSPASKDSRLWESPGEHLLDRTEGYQLGTVPEDQIVGPAFFVYWPSGLRPGWLPVVGDIGFIPNVGRMRWIR